MFKCSKQGLGVSNCFAQRACSIYCGKKFKEMCWRILSKLENKCNNIWSYTYIICINPNSARGTSKELLYGSPGVTFTIPIAHFSVGSLLQNLNNKANK